VLCKSVNAANRIMTLLTLTAGCGPTTRPTPPQPPAAAQARKEAPVTPPGRTVARFEIDGLDVRRQLVAAGLEQLAPRDLDG
jgi:hypothetical protein